MMPGRISRRAFAAGGLAATGELVLPARTTRAQDDQKVLRILGWPSYFNDTLTGPFREANNCRIEVTGIATPDDTMLFLRAGGIGFYDIVAPNIGLVNPLGASGLLAELDPTKLTNLDQLFPKRLLSICQEPVRIEVGVQSVIVSAVPRRHAREPRLEIGTAP